MTRSAGVDLVPVSLAGTASYLPETVVDNSFFGLGESTDNGAIFRYPEERRHVAPGESATDMIEHAATKLADKLNIDLGSEVDIILTNVALPDQPFTGCGASVSRRLGCRPKHILDLHNTGCVSFIYMMQVARALITADRARSALICNVQSSAGRVFGLPGNRDRKQAPVPGDGCGVGLVVAGDESPVLSIATRSFGEYAEDMRAANDDGAPWWEPHETPLYIDFTEDRIASIVARGNRLVPEIIREALAQADVANDDVDLLITNQPNPVFLRNWRESLLLQPDSHVHTFAEHGNLFGAAIPISFERAGETGQLKRGSKVVLGGFSHAGDYAAAAVIDWQARDNCQSGGAA